MQIESRMSDQVAAYLDLASMQAKLTAANMANVDTPGYKAVAIDFEAEMRAAIAGSNAGLAPHAAHARLEDGLIARPDGNNVSLDRESLNLAEAQLKFKTGVAILRQQNQMLMDAIHADR